MNSLGINHFKQWFDQEYENLRVSHEEKIVFRQAIIASRQKEFKQLRKSHAQMLQDGVKFDFDHEYSKIISVTRKEIVKGYLQIIGFTVLITSCLLFLWTPFGRKAKINVFFAIPESVNSQSNANEFLLFLSDSRIPTPKSAVNVVQNQRFNFPWRNKKNLKYVFRIETFLISRLSIRSRLIFFCNYFKRFLLLTNYLRSNKYLFLCIQQYLIEIPIVREVEGKQIIASLSTTNSTYIRQHASFYILFKSKVPLYMFWYSENSHPKMFGGGPETFDYQNFNDISVKEHLVWTKDFSLFIQQFTKGLVTAIGSIMFYPNYVDMKAAKEIDYLVFDVTPYSTSSELDFYSTNTCTTFIESLREIFNQHPTKDLRVSIKQKRELNTRHSPEYRDLLKSLNWKIEPANANIYSLISSAKCVIGIPFTSAVLVASELNVPCFYFVNSDKFDLPDNFNGVPVVKTLNSMKKVITSDAKEMKQNE
jgi:polysaccharide biosynthesis PFTS motif protein